MISDSSSVSPESAWPIAVSPLPLGKERIRQRIHELAEGIRAKFAGLDVTAVVVMTGAMFFAADLIRQLRGEDGDPVLGSLMVQWVRAKSYKGTRPGRLDFTLVGLESKNVKDRHVLLIDDILDTAQTLHCVQERLQTLSRNPITSVVLLRKAGCQLDSYPVEIEKEHVGFEIENTFVVGYGLDWNEMYRELPYVRRLDPVAEK